MPPTQLPKLYALFVPSPVLPVKKATAASISKLPKASTEQALKGYHYLKSHSSRKPSLRSVASVSWTGPAAAISAAGSKQMA